MWFMRKNKLNTVEVEIPEGYEPETPRVSVSVFQEYCIIIPLKKNRK